MLHRLYSRPQRCDMSGDWVPMLAATALVLVITASSMYAQSEFALFRALHAVLLAGSIPKGFICRTYVELCTQAPSRHCRTLCVKLQQM